MGLSFFAIGQTKLFHYHKPANCICSVMWNNINLERCLARIKSQHDARDKSPGEIKPALTISRMSGAGGHTVASQLINFLAPSAPPGSQWTVFDKALMAKVLEEHGLPKMLADSMPEGKETMVMELIKQLRTGHPSTSKVVEHTIETIWRLAMGGYVVLVGRGANVITAGLPGVFHVRLVGSEALRVINTQRVYNYDKRKAQELVKSDDDAKRRYLREYFGKDIDDPQLYHLVINTDRFSYDTSARLIADTFLDWFQHQSAARSA